MSSSLIQKTYSPKPSDITKKWYLVDATGWRLGRLASEIAKVLSGKHKPIYSHHMDTGDFVVVINADKIELSGNKIDQKIYYRHTGYIGGLKETPVRRLMEEKPGEVLRKAVRGMLPNNKLRRPVLNKLKVHVGPEHPHGAQQLEILDLGGK